MTQWNSVSRSWSRNTLLNGPSKGTSSRALTRVSHEWLIKHARMDKEILKKWLNAGYVENNVFHRTDEGTPQGGIISPTLANIALDGLEAAIKRVVRREEKVHLVRKESNPF